MTAKTHLILHGANGRMGRAVREVAGSIGAVVVDRTFDPRVDDGLSGVSGAVVIDFSLPIAINALLEALRGTGLPLVSGTTGLSMREHEALREYAREAPVFYAESMSFGVAVLSALLPTATRYLGSTSDIEIVEMHHSKKRDAPSGTALTLARAAGAGEGRDIPIHSVRAGGVPGDHDVIYASDEEVVVLSHRALSRNVFARGSIRAARFIEKRAAGLYRMHDLLEAQQEAQTAKG